MKSSAKHFSKGRSIVFFFILIILFLLGFFYYPLVFRQHTELIQPDRFESQNGLLQTTLTAKKEDVLIDSKTVNARVYNGSYQTPLFVLQGGDRFRVRLKNELDEPTNLHFHGSHVSPKGHSDNVLIEIWKGETFDYEYHLPDTHPPGLYWYHPHTHPYVENQVYDGMAGPIIVKGAIDELEGIKGVPEKILVLQSRDSSDENKPVRLVNGMNHPKISIRPGEVQRWRIVNASADTFYNFAIQGMPLHIISRDGNTTSEVVTVDSELMSPGDRIEILVRGGFPGNYAVKSLKFDAEKMFHYVEDDFLTLQVAGIPLFPTQSLPTELLAYDDLKNASIDNYRTLSFGFREGEGGDPQFLLDGKMFDPDEIDQIMQLNMTEEWRLVNETDMWHPFHIHINPFQVMSINGKEVDRKGYDDTFGIPAKGEVTIRTVYRDFTGKFVLHCHILFHEDHGMMQVVEVVSEGEEPAPHNGVPEMERLLQHGTMKHE